MRNPRRFRSCRQSENPSTIQLMVHRPYFLVNFLIYRCESKNFSLALTLYQQRNLSEMNDDVWYSSLKIAISQGA